MFPFTAQAREHFGRKTESVDYIAVVRITITITITITMLRSAPRRIVTGPQPDAMMPSTMIRTTRHDTSRQVAFASCFMRRWRDQLPVAGSSEINSLAVRPRLTPSLFPNNCSTLMLYSENRVFRLRGCGAQPREKIMVNDSFSRRILHARRPTAPRWIALLETCTKQRSSGQG